MVLVYKQPNLVTKFGEKLHIALYSKGHSVIEIQQWLNAEIRILSH